MVDSTKSDTAWAVPAVPLPPALFGLNTIEVLVSSYQLLVSNFS